MDGKRIGYDTTLEQPADGMSWKTETLESMRGYYETVLDRCRTGLKAHPEDKLSSRNLHASGALRGRWLRR